MNKVLTKSCSVCGLQKPLSAFLQYAGAEGATYGNVCAECRKTHLDQQKKPKELEDSTTTTSGKKIDTKARVAGEIGKLEEHKQKEDRYRVEEKKEEKEHEITIEKEEVAKHDKKQLEDFLKKRSFLSERKKEKPPINVTQAQQQEQAVQKVQQEENTDKQNQAVKEDKQKTDISLDVPFIDTQIAGKLKYQGRFKDFINWVGKGSAIGKAAENAQHSKEQTKEQTPEEFIEKNWTKKSGR